MAQPNAQNSELDPKKHPSGARIEKMVSGDKEKSNDKGMHGETLRPSERNDDAGYIPTQDKAEGSREDVHRRSPSNRDS